MPDDAATAPATLPQALSPGAGRVGRRHARLRLAYRAALGQVVHRRLPIANLPAALAGKTLVQISDLHIGPVVDEAFLFRAMQRVSSLGAEIIAITGDFMTCHTEQVLTVQRSLKHLKPGKLATLGILGNHDYGWRWANPSAADLLA